jgi:hypothetical protein
MKHYVVKIAYSVPRVGYHEKQNPALLYVLETGFYRTVRNYSCSA